MKKKKNLENLNKKIYILQEKLSKYFVEIDKKNEVISSDNSLKATIFKELSTAMKFKKELNNNYNKYYNIIEL